MTNQKLVAPERRLPDLELPAHDGQGAIAVHSSGRASPILVLTHGLDCPGCAAFLVELAAHEQDIADWDGGVIAIVPAPATATVSEIPFPIAVDRERKLATRLSLEPPAIVVADQWGEVHVAEAAGDGHRFPPVDELVEWAKYLAIQCPECQGEAL